MAQRNKRTLEKQEQKKLIRTIQEESIRDYMLIATALNHGLRNSETVKLQKKHVDLKQNVVEVRDGKGGKDRIVPIPSYFQDEFEYYFQEKDICKESDYLFPSKRSKTHLTPRAFQIKMREYSIEAGLYPEGIQYEDVAYQIPYEERIVPHSLRHTYATRLLRAGEPMTKVSRLLGHESIQVTVDVYGHLNIDDLRNSVERVAI